MLKIKGQPNMKFVAVHHSGGVGSDPYYSTQSQVADDINNWHRQRWPEFQSELGFWGGYNAFISREGVLTQFRLIGEETAANIGHNFDTISICLAGNFTINPRTGKAVDMPTDEQITKLKEVLSWICFEQKLVPYTSIVPHRGLWNTECYGNALADTWARDLVKPQREDQLKQLDGLEKSVISILDQIRALRNSLSLKGMFGGMKGTDGHGRG